MMIRTLENRLKPADLQFISQLHHSLGVTLAKLLNYSVPQFLTYKMALLTGLHRSVVVKCFKVMHVKSLEQCL